MKLCPFLLVLYAVCQKLIHQERGPIHLGSFCAFLRDCDYCSRNFVLVDLPQQFVGKHLCFKLNTIIIDVHNIQPPLSPEGVELLLHVF